MKYLILLLMTAMFIACNNAADVVGKNYVKGVEKDMTQEQVKAAAGEPTRVDDLGFSSEFEINGQDTVEKKFHYETWFYGDNQSVSFLNGKVTGVDKNIIKSNERIQQRIDSAKQAEGK